MSRRSEIHPSPTTRAKATRVEELSLGMALSGSQLEIVSRGEFVLRDAIPRKERSTKVELSLSVSFFCHLGSRIPVFV
jgi:hypothetical protein